MDLMNTRRSIIAGGYKKNYLDGIEWTLDRCILENGVVTSASSAKYTTNGIYLSAGKYLLIGRQSSEKDSLTVNYRVHLYVEGGQWIQQLQYEAFGEGDVRYEIDIPSDSLVKLSIAKSFTGALILLKKGSSNIAYEAWNLSFDRSTPSCINTGVFLFTEDNINRDFEVEITDLYGSYTDSSETILCAKHNGNSYGFLIRINSSTSATYKGTIAVKKDYNNSIVIRRINGVISVTGDKITNPKVQFTNAVHQRSLVLGCAVDDDGTYYRYGTGTIGHIVVRWL